MKVIKVKIEDKYEISLTKNFFLDNSDEAPSNSHLEELVRDDRTNLLVALLKDKVIGYALSYKFPSLYSSEYIAYLYDIEVLQPYKRQGVGRLLIESLLSQLKSEGVSELWLGTATDNVEGQAFFSSTGGIKSVETFNEYIYEL